MIEYLDLVSIGTPLSVRYFLFTDSVSVRYFLFTDTLSVNKFFLFLILKPDISLTSGFRMIKKT